MAMMTAIGIDTHKSSLAACAIDELGTARAEATFPNDPAGHRRLQVWAEGVVPAARIGVEGSSVYGAAAARFLLAAGHDVREVPPHLSRHERVRTRRAGKSDPGDALAIARVTARETDLPPVRTADLSGEIQLLTEARDDVVGEATRTRNRIHADLVILVPGYEARAAPHHPPQPAPPPPAGEGFYRAKASRGPDLARGTAEPQAPPRRGRLPAPRRRRRTQGTRHLT